ncbi:MAG: isoprenylcysteine carboxylmethyltransferase family protein [Candidatus Omnitrophica bacterium]|nr:isoprenylcysteine carboxylmethyltransferase family protein [Candidatus Omnitrophota bacterium]
MKKRIQINGIIIFIATLIVLSYSYRFFKQSTGLFDDFLEIMGIGLILLGQLLRVSARGYKSENSQSGNSLIQDGPYRMVRNPMYLGLILIGLGIVLFIFQFWAFIIFVLFFTFRYFTLIRKEEGILFNNFGQAYQDYKKKTPRLFPSPRFLFTTNIQEYLPIKFNWFKREFPAIIIVLCVSLIIESWEELGTEGWRVFMPEFLAFSSIIFFYLVLVLFLSRKDEDITKQN